MNVNTRSNKLGYTTSEAARRLGVSLSTIRRWSDLGYLRGYRTPGGQRRFSVQQLDEFLESLESGGPLRQADGDAGHDEPRIHRHHLEPPAPPVHAATFATEYAAPMPVWPPADAA
jgi:excisionase family DNA binding protein